MDFRKTATDAGYIAVGLGVMGYQQSRTRAAELRERLERSTKCATDVRDQIETNTRAVIDRAAELGGEVGKRVEPLVEQARVTLGELPEQVVRGFEPVRDRVRDLVSRAA
ncbi:MAG TPA: hypothetical protein VFZ83_06410 [Acidimicrobiia bacterium]|nr:hypothetical protein [Acidimicrobiia bacterium]